MSGNKYHYTKAIERAILKADKGDAIDVMAAASACLGTAINLIATMPTDVGIEFTKTATLQFIAGVGQARHEFEEMGMRDAGRNLDS